MEILAPAGDTATARAALNAGADAVYLGMTRFSAREGAANFAREELRATVLHAHLLGAKVYVCLNTLVKDDETEGFFEAARTAYECGADAVLLQDIFLGKVLKEAYPQMTLHLSTQAGCCNEWGARLAKEYGFSRVVLARETATEDIAAIAKIIETEVFVQGALCACFSGQCYLSSFAGNNSGNRGRCKQPCRKRYSIDRAGYEERAYALSPSDLSLGRRVRELQEYGVCSLKIEGRMRRPEYVAAAVSCYRAILQGKPAAEWFHRLASAYNRGDYTEGLAFGEKNFLSRSVQGHIGREVGVVSFVQNRPFCASACSFRKGDMFKILRGGKEVGGARFVRADKSGFFLESESRLKSGDTVRVTTDTLAGEQSLAKKRLRPLKISVTMTAENFPVVACGGFVFTGGERLQAAKNAPMTAAEIEENFCRTDGLPFAPEIKVETDGVFLPKSALNALRREFYAALCAVLDPPRAPLPERRFTACVQPVASARTALIATQAVKGDIVIYKTAHRLPEAGKERFCYLPPYFAGADELAYSSLLQECDGIYCEGYYGIALAKKYNKPLFAGTGFNLTNAFSVAGVRAAGAKYYALSKELSAKEQAALAGEGAFTLCAGDIKVMDLIFCPFSRTCKTCDKRDLYTLTDEDGRRFPLRRYGNTGACRFELYNCAPLAAQNGAGGALADITVCNITALADRSAQAETLLPNATAGHKNRSML